MPDLPHGTITFLFTDIEGSTRLWQDHPEAMGQAVARHLALVRSVIEAHGGMVFKTVGDAVCAAFPEPSRAVAAALEGQEALHREAWGVIGALRVRMALHAGEAVPQDGDYLGPTVNRVARLVAAAHGGQVLLSLPTAELVRDRLPPGTTFRDLGEVPLRDLDRPERAVQLLHPALPTAFPPPRAEVRPTHNLPTAPTPFLGRAAVVGQISALLRDPGVRLLTLTGSGGVGKTRLALRVAADLLEAFPDGVRFVGLAPITDPALVLPAIARVVGVVPTGDRPLGEAVAAALRDKRLLLVLDNFEQVVEAAPQVADLLAGCPDLTVLVTSRVPLRVAAEHRFPVPPMSLPSARAVGPIEELAESEAVALFVARAKAARPDFALTASNAEAVATTCTRLDGLPLAIELAAARVGVLPPPALLTRLDQRLRLLTGGARDLPARQRAMRDTIAWSYDLLTPEERALFRRLAVFTGGFTLEAAEAGVGNLDDPDHDVLDGVTSLVDASLLKPEEGPDGGDSVTARYLMLETIREFALERLVASGEEGAVRDRHAAFFVALAERGMPAVGLPGSLARLEPAPIGGRSCVPRATEYLRSVTRARAVSGSGPYQEVPDRV
ncbi:MAG: adenylate/guanylate cyclase domain-containing protein, partial [Chloroflexota bacterium]|nr:adenylate/guanylate cyclase domain-containing protein [Chloroflexota bacterium]